jgi:eukaryotic-like serine/threonine-protein kinase
LISCCWSLTFRGSISVSSEIAESHAWPDFPRTAKSRPPNWRRRLQTWRDRRFFREDYQQEQVLVRLIDEVRQWDSVAEIAQLVTARIDSVLHPTALHIFYRAKEDSEFVSGRSVSESASQPPSQQVLSEQQTLARVMDDAPTQQHLSCSV